MHFQYFIVFEWLYNAFASWIQKHRIFLSMYYVHFHMHFPAHSQISAHISFLFAAIRCCPLFLDCSHFYSHLSLYIFVLSVEFRFICYDYEFRNYEWLFIHTSHIMIIWNRHFKNRLSVIYRCMTITTTTKIKNFNICCINCLWFIYQCGEFNDLLTFK